MYHIASDIDGTKIRLGGDTAFVMYLKAQGIPFNEGVFAETHCWLSATGYTNEELSHHYATYHRDGHYRSPGPLAGAPAAFRVLHETYPIHLVTGRGVDTRESTLKELATHFVGISYISHQFGACGRKVNAIKKTGAFVHLEDGVLDAKAVATETEAYVIVISQPDNVDMRSQGRIIVPHAHKDAHRDLAEEQWDDLHRRLFAELPDLIADVAKSRHRRIMAPSAPPRRISKAS